MTENESGFLAYKRSRFRTRLPRNRLYTQSHYWLRETETGIWRAGFTKFATRMLGDMVEFEIEARPTDIVEIGGRIGWIEGFKAVSDLYAVAEGEFLRVNPRVLEDITLVESSPYEEGWLYEVQGRPEPEAIQVEGYAGILDTIVDKMLASRHEQPE